MRARPRRRTRASTAAAVRRRIAARSASAYAAALFLERQPAGVDAPSLDAPASDFAAVGL